MRALNSHQETLVVAGLGAGGALSPLGKAIDVGKFPLLSPVSQSVYLRNRLPAVQ